MLIYGAFIDLTDKEIDEKITELTCKINELERHISNSRFMPHESIFDEIHSNKNELFRLIDARELRKQRRKECQKEESLSE